MTRGSMFGAALLLAATAGTSVAQTKDSGPPGKHAGVSFLGTKTKQCQTNSDCKVTVFAMPGNAHTTCTVAYEFAKIVVARSRHPKVVWIVQPKNSSDPGKYRFADYVGIQLDAGNDPSKDFADGMHDDVAKKRYRWRSVNANQNPPEISYIIRVLRKAPGQDWENAEECTPVDPTIQNNGP